MERLTNKREADAQRKDYENRIRNGYPQNIPEERFLRLAAYEDTGLAPEDCAEYRKFEDEIIASGKTFGRLIELLKADKEGRVVVYDTREEADVTPVVHGRWVQDYYFDEPVTRCSVCKVGFAKGHKADRFPHCPNCGAKMDGGTADG